MGVAFAGLTVVWALVAGDVVAGKDVRFLLPAPWVLAGAAGLLALVLTDRRRHGTRATGWIGLEETPATDPPEDPTTAERRARASHRPARTGRVGVTMGA